MFGREAPFWSVVAGEGKPNDTQVSVGIAPLCFVRCKRGVVTIIELSSPTVLVDVDAGKTSPKEGIFFSVAAVFADSEFEEGFCAPADDDVLEFCVSALSSEKVSLIAQLPDDM